METNECQKKVPNVKWPIAPDGYIPNSVIRGWIRMLKRAKWESDEESAEEDEEFYIGHYGEDYKGLRAKRRVKKSEQRSYVKWDYRPELDERLELEDKSESESQSEEDKEGTWSKDGKKNVKNEESLDAGGVKGKKDGLKSSGFDLSLERKRREGVVNESNKEKRNNLDHTHHSGAEREKETKTTEALKEKDLTKQDKIQYDKVLTKENAEKVLCVSNESQDPAAQDQRKAADQNQNLPDRQSTSDTNIKTKDLWGDASHKHDQLKTINEMYNTTYAKDGNILQATSTVSTVSSTETQKTGEGRMESTQQSTSKTESLMSKPSSILESGPGLPGSELREAKDLIDAKTKPLTKQHKLSEANTRSASAEKPDISKVIDEPLKHPVDPLAPSSEFPVQQTVGVEATATLKQLRAGSVAPGEERHDFSKAMDKPLKPPVDPLALSSESPVQHTVEVEDRSTLRKLKAGSVEPGEETHVSRGALPGQQTKPPKQDKRPQPVSSESKSQVSTSTRNSNLVPVDHKVIALYRKLKTGKQASSKAHGKWSSPHLHQSLFKSKWPSGETVMEQERLGAAESVYQQGSGEQIGAGSTGSVGQSGLWKLIMNGVSKSMDQNALGSLLKDRLIDGPDKGGLTEQKTSKDDVGLARRENESAQSTDKATLWDLIADRHSVGTSTGGQDMEGLTFIRDKSAPGAQGSPRPSRFQDHIHSGTQFTEEAAHFRDNTSGLRGSESRDQAAFTGKINRSPTEFAAHAGRGRQGPSAVREEITPGSMGPYGILGLIETGPESTVQAQRFESRTGTRNVVLERSTESHYTGPEVFTADDAQSTVDIVPGLRSHNPSFKQTDIQGLVTETDFGGPGMEGHSGSRSENEAIGLAQTTPKIPVQTSFGTNLSRSHDSSLFQGLESMGQRGPERLTEFRTHPGSGRHRPSESQTTKIRTTLGRPDSEIPCGIGTETPFVSQTSSQEISTDKPEESKESLVQTTLGGTDLSVGLVGAGWEQRDTAPQITAQTGPGDINVTSRSHDSLKPQAIIETGSQGQGGGLGGFTVPQNQTGTSGQCVQTYTQSTIRTRDKGSRSQDLLRLQEVQSMVHTPGFLSSPDPEQFLKALSQPQHRNRPNNKLMPKWRQRLYQHIFLYGFCSPQTAKLLAKEKHAKTSETEKEHKDPVELYQLWDSISPGSAVHERVVRRIQFQDIADQVSSDVHCVIPLPSINNFITLDKFGETEYGKLMFEWERGDEEDDHMKVISKSVTM